MLFPFVCGKLPDDDEGNDYSGHLTVLFNGSSLSFLELTVDEPKGFRHKSSLCGHQMKEKLFGPQEGELLSPTGGLKTVRH